MLLNNILNRFVLIGSRLSRQDIDPYFFAIIFVRSFTNLRYRRKITTILGDTVVSYLNFAAISSRAYLEVIRPFSISFTQYAFVLFLH